MSRAKTKEEVRAEVLDMMRTYVDYWANEARTPDVKDKLSGLAFSILNIFDGTTMDLPAFDIVCSPHPDDEAFNKSEGEDWYPAGLVINDDVHMHDEWHKRPAQPTEEGNG